jgi:2-polyprenyl-3-methyl-5-hydroxy-6-metoxy-1,4-benzoquinol methylase
MPIGNAYATGNIIAFIEQHYLKNRKLDVLDIGCGIGHNGFIFREMFDIRYLRLKPKDWLHWVEAIEIYQDYRNPIWDYFYNKVTVGDCLEIIPVLDKEFDIVFATEILEHFEKGQVYLLLDNLFKKLNQEGSVIITIPLGNENAILEQKELFGNIHEEHRTYLTIDDFKKYSIKHKVNDGIFMIGK